LKGDYFMSSESKSHQQGMIDGIEMWGRVCGSQGNCETCPIGSIRGANVTCQDFARQFPAKMLSILKEMDQGEINYYEEYCIRFPECTLPVEALAACTCRKAVFEGYLDCEEVPDGEDFSACVECWKQKYNGDVTEFGEDAGLTNV
jgi:hypothetical protein